MTNPQTDRIRCLNDKFRENIHTGSTFITPGVAALGQETVNRIVQTITVFDDFCHANDLFEEHDFSSFDVDDSNIFFKIDPTYHSPASADPAVTCRVITIMLAEEY